MKRYVRRSLPIALAACAAVHSVRADTPEADAGATLATSGLFRPWIKRSLASQAEAAAVGDLNGDGRNDVVVVTSFGSIAQDDWTAHVFLQQPSGAFPPLADRYPLAAVGGGGCQSVAVGDVTGDGRVDVVVATTNGVVVLPQTPAGVLGAPVLSPTAEARQLTLGDFNHDGRQDVASIAHGGPTVSVFLQTAAGALAAPAAYPAPHGGFDEIEAGDLDGDGRDDIAVIERPALRLRQPGRAGAAPVGRFRAARLLRHRRHAPDERPRDRGRERRRPTGRGPHVRLHHQRRGRVLRAGPERHPELRRRANRALRTEIGRGRGPRRERTAGSRGPARELRHGRLPPRARRIPSCPKAWSRSRTRRTTNRRRWRSAT